MESPAAGPPHPAVRLDGALARLARSPPSRDLADAAVTAVLRLGPVGLETLAIQRTKQEADPWSGQVGLPGGRKEPSDRTLRETAMRELHEEVGFGSGDLDQPLRTFGLQETVFSIRVAVFVATARPGSRPCVASPQEVAAWFWFPLGALKDVETVPVDTGSGTQRFDATIYQNHVVWGFTRGVLLNLDAWWQRVEQDGAFISPAQPRPVRRLIAPPARTQPPA